MKEPRYIFELGELFERVQLEAIFPDSKSFVDSAPKRTLPEIKREYESQKSDPSFDLKTFVAKHFDAPQPPRTEFHTKKNISLSEHIEKLWNVLTVKATTSNTSLIALPNPYVVPGGRFREMFYWDTYFTMLGLALSGRHDLIENMMENFVYLIKQYGYIPNGNRAYFLGRSQPPFFVMMIELSTGNDAITHYLPSLRQEYDFWMKDSQYLTEENPSAARVVRMPDGTVLNRYWDHHSGPRPEAYRKDVLWSEGVSDKESFFRHERAACESGWDFSTRWYIGSDIRSNRCADIVPVDLNCLLLRMEQTLMAHADGAQKVKLLARAEKRAAAIEKYFWNADAGFFFDFNFNQNVQSKEWTLAAAFPLFLKTCSASQAASVSHHLQQKFLRAGGLLTTLRKSDQQWDAPNGWAPLQWVAIRGMMNYDFVEPAKEVARRWMSNNEQVFEKTGKMMEKYNVELAGNEAVAGTYPTQDGFGWTNGVYLACRQLFHEQEA